jgi:uncharacterized protein (DUF1015 family)
MAIVSPFAAICYDAQKVGGLERVLTQPYDKITPEMQKDYFARSPYNLAYIIRGEIDETDSPADSVYSRAAARFRAWREQGILIERPKPALYAYFQEFCVPGRPARSRMVRKGLIGLGKLEEYSSGVVFRHEQTLSAPKADRLDLLRATRAHFGQIFMLYSDPERAIDRLLDRAASYPPFAQVEDDYGTVHTLWEIDDPLEIEAIRDLMQDRKLVIADGHHRYETALNFQRECAAASPHNGSEDCSHVMMTFINMDSEGIAILPTHRLVSGVPEFTRSGFLSRAARYFKGREYAWSSPSERSAVMRKLESDMAASAAAGRTAIGAVFHGHDAFYLLELREEAKRLPAIEELSPPERSLDVNILHRIAFGLCLGMDEESVREEKFLTYVREFEEGAQRVFQDQAQACFFLNPVKIQQVKEIALEGKLLPQKSTDFYPKLLSGLAIYHVRS